MATEPATRATPLPALQDEERAKERCLLLQVERRQLREDQLQEELKQLERRHQAERRALSKELRELAVGRKVIQDQVWADWIKISFPDLGPERHNLTPEQQQKLSAELHDVKHHLDGEKERALDSRLATLVEQREEEAALKKLSREVNRRPSQQKDGASSSTALNGKEGTGEGDEEIPNWVDSVLKEEKQALLKELLPAKNELHVEVQRLLEVLDKKELLKAYEHRIKLEDPREIRAHQQTLAAARAGLWRFVSKKKVEAERKLVELEGTAKDHIAYVDDENLGFPKLPDCYEEIKTLLDIEKNPIFSKALQEWTRKEELYTRRVESKKNRVGSLKNEVYQLIGFFSVFQGVVLTAVSQSNLLYCHNKWSPIALSVLASLISTIGVIQKLYQINPLQKDIDNEERSIKTAVRVGQLLRDPGPKGLDFVQLNAEIHSHIDRKPKWWEKKLAWLYFVLVTLTLVAFGVLFPVSFWRILCKPGAPPPAH